VLTVLAAAGHRPPMVHAANSAATLAFPATHFDMVRAGIAIYGIAPGPALEQQAAALRPALSLRARVSHVKRVRAGERISYGLRHRFDSDATVATLPLGYADGVRRGLFAAGGVILIGGRRRPIVGVVTMDQVMVDCGDDSVSLGDEAVLIGVQGADAIAVGEWADRLGTIGYEVVCGISARIDRRYAVA
jgi:alanine racemase